jgi:protein involved in polysaccharide export with SLBB domain
LTPSLALAQRVDQLSDAQIGEFLRRAQASGLSETQIEKAALAQGYTPADVARMRERIQQVQGTKPAGAAGTAVVDTSVARRVAGDTIRLLPSNAVSAPVEKSVVDTPPVSQQPEVFGAGFFRNASLSFEPNLRLATPKNYVLGPDDELNVEVYGNSVQTYKLKISPEGTVRFENAVVPVSGLSIEAAQARISSQLRRLYGGAGINVRITLGSIRTIQVTVTGEVVKPGSYSVPSLATAFNVIYRSGGPTPNGSLRRIQLRRDNQVIRTIDLYDFLLRADQRDNLALRDQDVLIFTDYGAKVELTGEVRRPAIYEIKSGETLKDVLGFAGGFTDAAYTATLSVRRNTPRELKMLTVAHDEIPTFAPQSGDRYTVGTILERYENRVEIRGAVFRPGEYALDGRIRTVGDLVRQADGLKGDAFLARASIRRERDNLDAENLSFDLGRLLRGELPDVPLRRQDVVTVQSINDLREPYAVSIGGAVNAAGVFPFEENLSVADLIARAGGFSEGATGSRVEVSRRIKDESLKLDSLAVQVFQFDVSKDLALSPQDAAFRLQPFDAVQVRAIPSYEAQRTVVIDGEVRFAGVYAIQNRAERISDLIRRAGGLKPEAFLRAARFTRQGQLVAVDLEAILRSPEQAANLRLEAGDAVFIPKKTELVRIAGAVENPATVNFERGMRFKDYLSRAGGFSDVARRSRTYVTRANGTTVRTKKRLFFNKYPRVETGSTITVPTRPAESRRLDPAERVAVFSVVGSFLIAVGTVLAAVLRN